MDDRFAVIEGERLFINLTLDANPIPGQGNFTWSFNGIQFSPTGDINFGLDFIDFGVVNRNEAGSYMVEATNLAGTGSAMFQLDVYCKYMLKWDVAVNCRASIIFAAILLYNI